MTENFGKNIEKLANGLPILAKRLPFCRFKTVFVASLRRFWQIAGNFWQTIRQKDDIFPIFLGGNLKGFKGFNGFKKRNNNYLLFNFKKL